ncbi:MAG: NeuD/PglB/VioB family sugar acetyltransferase [Alicyclobacillus sp.]|uniref:NeuD/PglB/VioB family sugar acetyltransferase n=1 Tax=Alicyclobacillus herbarius TaxID=122960 RepID=UPI0003FD2F97|nr:NeuD/PglB/VioB family sugar acetyltransferase [Alicyclobacillus herbarius]MCL6446063.1 NeuD/PglB/VioB family sugar acetyltransferase [Alicyclobacillus sp.]
MNIGIFGASGLAVEVADICQELGYHNVVLIDKEKTVKERSGFPIRSEDAVETLAEAGYHFVIAIGSPELRRQVYRRYPDLQYVNIVHPAATFGRRQALELHRRVGNIVLAGARMTSDIQCGNFGIYNQNCTIAHDCVVEDFVTIGPGANVSGNVHLQECAYIGTGSVILQGASRARKMVIGRHATIGAGAVVTRHVPDHHVVKGVPAK